MKIPEKIRIGGVDHPVSYEERLNDGEHMLRGQINYCTNEIKLLPDHKGSQGELQTLWHEIVHGICQHFDMDIRDNEDIVDKLAKGVYMVIADNPDMFVG